MMLTLIEECSCCGRKHEQIFRNYRDLADYASFKERCNPNFTTTETRTETRTETITVTGGVTGGVTYDKAAIY